MTTSKTAPLAIRQLKRPDLVAQEIKRLITEKNHSPGDRLPRESELQAQFQVSKGTIREALKSLEVQGLITISTGPSGGGMVVEVPLDRTLQFMQNYLFFQEVTIDDIYTVRQMLEPELAAGAVPHLTDADFEALEHSIACCDPTQSSDDLVSQRREDVNFHDILAAANPNPFLRFTCELINEMIRQLIVFANRTPQAEHRRFGEANAQFHRDIVQAARERDAARVRALMQEHMRDAASSVKRMKGRIQGRLILDADSLRSPRPQRAVSLEEKPGNAAPKPARKPAPGTVAGTAAKTVATAPAKSPTARPAAVRRRAAS
jgi:DNA-binding FadR family transcriptional regulator